MDVSVFTVHTTQSSALPEPSGTDRSNLRGQDWNFLSSSKGNTQTWVLMPLDVYAQPHFSKLPNLLPRPSGGRPILSSPRGWEPTAKLPHSEEGLSQEAEPAFVYQRSDYVVGCYLSLGDGCRVSRMTALTPVGDVWSGMERHGLTEVLGSYRTQCDLNSHWIPWGDKRPQLRGGNQAPWLILLLLCVQ